MVVDLKMAEFIFSFSLVSCDRSASFLALPLKSNYIFKGRVQKKKKLEFSNRGGGGPKIKKFQLFQKQCNST